MNLKPAVFAAALVAALAAAPILGAGQSAPAITAQTDEAEEKPGMGKPILYIAIAGVIAIGAIGGKMFMKARAKADGSQGA